MNPVNVWCPCGGDAYEGGYPHSRTCCYDCHKAAIHGGKCTGSSGWPILALAAAEVALERATGPSRTGGTVTTVTIYRQVQDDWGWET